MTGELGLRERKKARTRAAIRDAAIELFAQRGFEAVRVAEVAERADVSEATVYNYFPTKEDLVYGRLETFRAELLEGLRARDKSHSLATAFRDFLLSQRAFGSSADERSALQTITRIITTSPALLARERALDAESTAELATLIATEARAPAGDVRPWAAANALLGVHRALIAFTREQVLAGATGPALARRVRAQTVKAFALLDNGLASYPALRTVHARKTEE